MARGSGERSRVTERVHVRVERWKKGARKPETETITVIRTRSRLGPPATSIEELARNLGVFTTPPSEVRKTIPGRKDEQK